MMFVMVDGYGNGWRWCLCDYRARDDERIVMMGVIKTMMAVGFIIIFSEFLNTFAWCEGSS